MIPGHQVPRRDVPQNEPKAATAPARAAIWLAAALCALAPAWASCQLYDYHECGSDPVNWAKAEISALDPADPAAAARFEELLDLYWTDPGNRWCSPTGAANTGWGHDKGLMYFALYDAGRVWRELERSGVRFTEAQAAKLRAVFLDALAEAAGGTYYYFGKCNLFAGRVNFDNSCAEDDAAISKFVAVVRNLFPELAAEAGGDGALAALERRFFEKAYSTDYEHGGGLLVVDGEVTLPNHGGPSYPYAAVNIIGANNARDAYLLAGNGLPEWYRHPNLGALFRGLQTRALSDGSAFTDNCFLNSGSVVSCGDPGGMNAAPGMLPAGRFVRAVFGEEAFTGGLYTFERCDTDDLPLPDRLNQYCAWNPGTLRLGVLPVAGSPWVIDVRWLAAEGAAGYDLWWLGARVAAGLTDTSHAITEVPCGVPLGYAVFARGARGRTLGGEWGATEVVCSPRPVREHLLR